MNLQFEIAEDEVERLQGLMKEAGVESYRELFNTSLTLFQWAIKEVKEGKVVASIDEQNQRYTEVQMEALKYVQEQNEEVKQAVNA